MKNDLQRGVVIGLSIYGIGTILALTVHQIFGWHNPHSPPASATCKFMEGIQFEFELLNFSE